MQSNSSITSETAVPSIYIKSWNIDACWKARQQWLDLRLVDLNQYEQSAGLQTALLFIYYISEHTAKRPYVIDNNSRIQDLSELRGPNQSCLRRQRTTDKE
jgi:hypothetical protein